MSSESAEKERLSSLNFFSSTCAGKQVLPLFQSLEKLDSKQAQFAGSLLPEDLGRDRGSFVRNQARRGSRRGGNGQMDDLFRPQQVVRSNACPGSADIERFCELNEFDPRRVLTPQEDGYLEADPGKSTLYAFIHSRGLCNLSSHNWTFGTTELVRFDASLGPESQDACTC